MKKLVLLFVAMFALSVGAFANNYEINDNDVDALFATATEVSSQEINAFGAGSLMMANSGSSAAYLNAPNPWAAFALCWVVGGFGIHRHYLGTSSSMWAIYTFTCGGIFGIVPLVDWVVLLIGAADNNIKPFVNNKSFFMWM
ncbi:MAG: TM2 domain-containing protein [Bacteroidales bacterium]